MCSTQATLSVELSCLSNLHRKLQASRHCQRTPASIDEGQLAVHTSRVLSLVSHHCRVSDIFNLHHALAFRRRFSVAARRWVAGGQVEPRGTIQRIPRHVLILSSREALRLQLQISHRNTTRLYRCSSPDGPRVEIWMPIVQRIPAGVGFACQELDQG
jgi:hypothetical protein